jgi:hypothetical protein
MGRGRRILIGPQNKEGVLMATPQEEHNQGQKDGAEASLAEYTLFGFTKPFYSEPYVKGFEHGYHQKIYGPHPEPEKDEKD